MQDASELLHKAGLLKDVPPKTVQHNFKALINIAEQIDETQYGSITVTLRIHNGAITDLVYQSFKRTRLGSPDKA